jgi:hypothetical protein
MESKSMKWFMSIRMILSLGVFVCFTGETALAQIQPVSLPSMVAASGVIFSGKITKVWSERDASTGFLVTYSTVTVAERLRGVNSSQFTFKQYGGRHDGLNVFVADMSYFSVGEEVVAFLYPVSALGLTSPVGTTEGKFLIQRDAATGKKIVLGNLMQSQLLEPFVGKSALPAATPVEYDQFIAMVRDLVQRQAR